MLQRINWNGALALPALVLCLTAVGCDDGEESTEATTAADTTGADTADSAESGGAGNGRCAMDQAILMCGQTECAFEPTDVDCALACANIAAVCAANACDEQCTGVESDATLCGAACEGTKGLNCSNVVFGCYAANNSCEDVGSCAEANI